MIESDEMAGASKNGMGTSSPHVEILIPPWWAEAAEAIARTASQPPVAFICGPKNSGKSTFSRYLLNILLERYKRVVGYLDTDVGQPEFSPPGCLSLHIIGENILDLMNTSLKIPERVLIHKDVRGLRDRRLFEYFKQCFPTDMNISTNKELAYALASLPPYILPFSKVKVMHLHCQVPSNEIWHSLNATIVGLAVSTDGTVMSRSTPWCVGLGIVRGVDVTEGLLYVITPVPLRCLRSVDLLLQGFVELPTSILQVRGCVSPYMSTNVLHRISDKDL